MRHYRFILPILLCIVFISASTSNLAGAEGTNLGPDDPAELEAFFDTYFAKQMEEHHIPGVVFSVVKDGTEVFSKGYGYSDLEKQTPYDPDETTLLVASLAKVPTFVGILQLYDQGVFDLNDDVRQYVTDFELGDESLGTLTFANLLTHTDGFEARLIGIAAVETEDLNSLAYQVKTFMPSQLFAPGEFLTYGDYAATLSGYLVEEISGQPYAQYIDTNIFQPLGMNHSTLEHNLPESWYENMVMGYEISPGGEAEATHFFYVQNAPAGAMRTTATDMSRFMIALMDGGSPILSADTVALMFEEQFASHQSLPGITYGLFVHEENGKTAYVRDGDGIGTRSRMVLFPDEDLGFFVSYNTGGDDLRLDIISDFLDRFYPDDKPLPESSEDFGSQARKFTGSYQVLNWDPTSYASSVVFFSGQIRIEATEDGRLAITPKGGGDTYGGFGQGTSYWVAVEPLVFMREDGRGLIAFDEDERGRVTHMYSGQQYHGAYKKVPFYGSTDFHLIVLIFWVTVLASFVLATFVVWPISALMNRRRKQPAPHTDRKKLWLARVGRLWGGVVCLLLLNAAVYIFGVLYAIGTPVVSMPAFAFGVPENLEAALNGVYLPLTLALGMPLFAVLARKGGYWKRWVWLHYVLVILVIPIVIWFLQYWNVLGIDPGTLPM